MLKIKKLLDSTIRYIMIVLLASMCFVVFWQVVSRFILGNPSRWSEELARYLMIWLAFLGAAVGINTHTHLGFVLLTKRIKNETVKKLIQVLVYLLLIFFSVVLIIYGWEYMVEGHKQRAMSFDMKMSYVYAVIPISGILMIINSVQESIILIRNKGEQSAEVISGDL